MFLQYLTIVQCQYSNIVVQVQLAKDKLDAVRLEDLTDNEETIAELKRRHEREKLLLLEDNKKLMLDLDTVSNFYIVHNYVVLLSGGSLFYLCLDYRFLEIL